MSCAADLVIALMTCSHLPKQGVQKDGLLAQHRISD